MGKIFSNSAPDHDRTSEHRRAIVYGLFSVAVRATESSRSGGLLRLVGTRAEAELPESTCLMVVLSRERLQLFFDVQHCHSWLIKWR